jgi:hypothetical protein
MKPAWVIRVCSVFDALGLVHGGQGSKAGCLAGLNPCLPQRPGEALPANVGKLDLGEIVGPAEDPLGPAHCICLN